MRDRHRALRLWWAGVWRRLLGGALVLASFVVTIILAASASSTQTPTQAQSVTFVVLAGVFQLAGAYMFSQNGKPDASHASAAVRRLLRIAIRAKGLSRAASTALAGGNSPTESKRILFQISAQLDYVAEDALDSVEDWTTFNPDARRKVDEINRELES